ncbi:NUDIX hydrolase [Dethiothermospora halolimnae]|uniref:NUDIX hydrolase n=1 Tax=Dethiothermospora halolimnae TaxID=3114390 RepID=UPI003CCB856A
MDYVKYIRERVGHDAINLTGVNVLILNDKDEVLLQKRGTYPYKWGLIGGITELGEDVKDTAIREAKEETGLNVKDLSFLDITSGKECYMECPNGDKVYFISIGYYTSDYEGDLFIDMKETMELGFFDYNSLPNNIPKTHRKMIDSYYNLKK